MVNTEASKGPEKDKGPEMGAGLGLSVVHDIAARSGGRLRIDRASSSGTAVELWLPRYSGYPMRGKSDQSTTNPGLKDRWS